MASKTYTQYYADGTSKLVRRIEKQGRKPQGLSSPQVLRLDNDVKEKLKTLAGVYGYYWNENQFIRDAVRDKLSNSVYTEFLNT